MGVTKSLGSRIRGLAFVIAAATPLCASALNDRVYQSSLSGGNYTSYAALGTATALGSPVSIGASSAQRNLVNNAQSAYLGLQTTLNQEVLNSARAAAASVSSGSVTVEMGVASGILSGAMAIDVSGSPYTGDVTVSVSGLRYVTSLSMHYKLGGWLDATCGVTVTMANIRLVSAFNPVTGLSTVPASVWYDMTHTESCDSNFWWLPGVYTLIDGELRNRIGSALQPAISSGQGPYFGRIVNVNPQLALFSLLGAVAPGTYMVGGIDVGSLIISTVSSTPALFYQKTLRLVVAQPASFFVPTLWNNNPGPSQRSGNAIRVDFCDVSCVSPAGSTQSAFGVNLTQYFTWTLISGEE